MSHFVTRFKHTVQYPAKQTNKQTRVYSDLFSNTAVQLLINARTDFIAQGEILANCMEPAHSLYIILSGSAQALVPIRSLAGMAQLGNRASRNGRRIRVFSKGYDPHYAYLVSYQSFMFVVLTQPDRHCFRVSLS